MAKCKGCGAEIVWIKTPAGRSMPCDPAQVIYREHKGAKGKVVAPNGEVLSGLFDVEPDKATGVGYIPHWATCSAARSFK